ncbi:MAG: (deoxy)nucleoside triphosphate pyrophosphohydrolase [Thermoanaerobaculum sp.]|nr:(deoxy)nucleoside triphosphate pyrophosphohydrolase [Thermoanaerobaculum sp.]MCX7895684.1 (deoxy)nucleoside triphosphate pyrophosphohydrolase [Thermoanaerobaculum sp.]MDW7968585.1 (deoxy)nucleoside triphosphate pyrophosphohydrolase [Thermoanaerobaculum sp.]
MANRSFRLVVAAIVAGQDGRFLLARRLPGAHLGGLWEFPGGGVEDGELPEEALVRELREELGVEIRVLGPRTFAFYREANRDLLLLFYDAELIRGEPQGLLGQEVGWFSAEELAHLPLPPADDSLVRDLLRGCGRRGSEG